MRGFFRVNGGMLPIGSLKAWLVGWLASEAVLLILVIKLLGFGGAVLLTFASSILGTFMLRRMGLDAARRLRSVVAGQTARDGALLDASMAALGALLLIIPGFVTDLVGLALASPSIRQTLLARFGARTDVVSSRPKPRRPADVIDLSPADWRVVETPRQG